MLQIHERIEAEREKAGLTQDQMAAKLKIKRSTYQYWEKSTPSVDKVKKVAKALGLPEDYFFGPNDEKFVSREKEDKKGIKMGFVAENPNDPPYFKDYIAALKEHNAFLQELVKLNLASLSDTQRVILAQVKAGNQYEAIKAGQGNKKKEEAVLKVLNTLAGANLTGVSSVDSKVTEGM